MLPTSRREGAGSVAPRADKLPNRRGCLLMLLLAGAPYPDAFAQTTPRTDPMPHAAPEREPEGLLLLDVTLNGTPMGVHTFKASDGHVLMPTDTAQRLRIRTESQTDIDLAAIASLNFEIDRRLGTIRIDAPVSLLAPQTLTPDIGSPALVLSPETRGAFVGYDLNTRRNFNVGDPHADYGGFASLHAFAPDLAANSGWSYDSARMGDATRGPVRLDSNLTWRPAAWETAMGLGDAISVASAAARPYRFTGAFIGTDHSAEPGWSPVPLASVSGSAQPASAIDLYINGLHSAQIPTAGGPFNLLLPPGVYSPGTRLVVTDITGRVVEIPFNVPRFNLDIIQRGMTLWAAGVGMPRFNWGSESNAYLPRPYAYGNLRYGITDQSTATGHVEGGPGVAELEAELRSLITPSFGLRGSIAGSSTSDGFGGFTTAGALAVLPHGLSADVSYARSTSRFNDAVSWSGQVFDRGRGLNPTFNLPIASSVSGQISWNPVDWLMIASSSERITYRGLPAVTLASLIANASLGATTTAYVSVLRDVHGAQGTAVMLGVAFMIGRTTNGSVSAGRQDGKFAGEVMLTRPLGLDRGDYGWQVSANQSAIGTYENAEAETRTGYGIPAVGYTDIAGHSQVYLRATGSLGVAAWHPFASDPIQSGVIIADVGQPGIPVLLNGFDSAITGFDGRAAVPVSVGGTPQRVEIADEKLALTAIAEKTRVTVTTRDGSGTVAQFSVRSSENGAIVLLRVDGKAPAAGSAVISQGVEIPIDKQGRAWVPQIGSDGKLTVEMPDGRKCTVATGFNGHGGPGRTIGPFDCRSPQ